MNMRYSLLSLLSSLWVICSCNIQRESAPSTVEEAPVLVSGVADSLYETALSALPEGVEDGSDSDFVLLAEVVPDIIQEIRYYTTYNFVGRRVPGYEAPVAWMTRRAADSLRAVSDELIAQGYRLKVFDAYRPQRAVLYFVGWARQSADTLMKSYFYPDVPKDSLYCQGYLSWRSAHARGSTIDLTLFDMETEREVDMGSTYDFLGKPSHFWYREGLTKEQVYHRTFLRDAMTHHGFKPCSTEWWHFQLINEPYPTQSFDFPVELTINK